MTDDIRDEWLRDRQDGRVFPVGQALRATYDAENHDTLGSDVTGLMIDLSKVPYGPAEALPPLPPAAAVAPARPTLMDRLGEFFRRR